jgi:dTDP-4-dehydrorhamnose reductase
VRLLVVGRSGQVAQALMERGARTGDEVVALGRPDLDVARPETILPAFEAQLADVVINAAAYTAVDGAESNRETAHLINAAGAGAVAAAAGTLGVPLIHISTDYVFDGRKSSPYVEDDRAAPRSAYGQSKYAGELAVRAEHPRHAILRTAWVYSPFGSNFVKTMLRLATDRDEVRVVGDQFGSPTSAFDLADAVLALAARLENCGNEGFGTFHATGAGTASWAGFAETVFAASKRHGGPTAQVVAIPTSEYPTAAERPANSRLDCSKLAEVHGIRLRHFKPAVDEVVARLLADPQSGGDGN